MITLEWFTDLTADAAKAARDLDAKIRLVRTWPVAVIECKDKAEADILWDVIRLVWKVNTTTVTRW